MKAIIVLVTIAGCGGEARRPDRGYPDGTLSTSSTDPNSTGGTSTGATPSSDTAAPETAGARLVIQGELIGIEDPLDEVIASDLATTPWSSPGVAVTLFYASGTNVGELPLNPVTGESVAVYLDHGPEALQEYSPGEYGLQASVRNVMVYEELTTAEVISDQFPGPDLVAWVYLPTSANLAIPPVHPVSTQMDLDLSNQGFQGAVAVVVSEDGEVIWTNDPSDITAMYDANAAPDVTTLAIPDVAFPSVGTFVIGVAGTIRTHDQDIEVMDPNLSAVRAGKMNFWSVSVVAK